MECQAFLEQILLELPFHAASRAKRHSKFNIQQCQDLANAFSSKLLKFLGDVHEKPPAARRGAKRWRSLSGFYDKSLSRLLAPRKQNSKSNPNFLQENTHLGILDELALLGQGIKELYRVIKDATSFLDACSSPDWWSGAVTTPLTAEAWEVHVHDLIWCIAGLDVALLQARGASMESLARVNRGRAAECYAELAGCAAEGAELVAIDDPFRNEDVDLETLASLLEQIKQRYDGMNVLRRASLGRDYNNKNRMAKFLLKKVRRLQKSRRDQHDGNTTSEGLPADLCIDIKDIHFPKRRCCIGKGSFGAVYEASWLGMKVAVKEFEYKACKGMFEDEASLCVTLQNPFVVQLIGWCVDHENNLCYLVMELVGNNLQSVIEDRSRRRKVPYTLPVAISIMLQVSRGMEYLHAKNIMHRDLKSSNVLVEPMASVPELMEEGYARVKLCDFGFAKLKLGSSRLTPHVGTTYWRAPEVWRSDEEEEVDGAGGIYSFKADVYSFAITCAEILSGKCPFSEITSARIVFQKVKGGERPSLPSTCPPVLIDYINLCWASDPNDRPCFTNISMMLRHFKLLLMTMSNPEKWLLREEVNLSLPSLSFQELKIATDDFRSRPSGIEIECLYKGVLPDGSSVLVQHVECEINSKAFWTHVALLFNHRHGNLACLRAFCLEGSQRWLVYDHMYAQKSLDMWLADPITEVALYWNACSRIALGVAFCLEFFHDLNLPCSVTPQNILVDYKFEPQILFLNLPASPKERWKRSRVSKPEVEGGDEVPLDFKTGDVFHFGVVLTEILSRLGNARQGTKGDSQAELVARKLRKLEGIASLCQKEEDGIRIHEVVKMLEQMLAKEGNPGPAVLQTEEGNNNIMEAEEANGDDDTEDVLLNR